jgi:hypothetical protein
MNIKFLSKTCDADQETRWFDIDGETYGLCDDKTLLDADGLPFPNGESLEIVDGIEEYLDVFSSTLVRSCNSIEQAIGHVNDSDGCNYFLAGSYLADAVLDDIDPSLREEDLQAQCELFSDAGAAFDHEKAVNLARRLLAAN